MSIEIKLYNKKWQLVIREKWEFETSADMEDCLKGLVRYKEVNGQQLKKEEGAKKGEPLW